ncbi:MAG: hypothetical protein MZV63_25810 [Marinilabiliales bacterium]|nr:hypothetical protein [Marinilabiliales bacterium]
MQPQLHSTGPTLPTALSSSPRRKARPARKSPWDLFHPIPLRRWHTCPTSRQNTVRDGKAHYDAVENTNWGPRFDGTLRQIGPTWPDGSYQAVPYAPVKDNLLAFFNTGHNLNNTVYLSGSHETSKFYLSVGDQRATGIVPDDTYQRNTVRVNASKKVGNVELSINSSFFKDESDEVGSTIGDQDRPLYWFLLNTSANIPLERYKNWETDLYATPDGYYNAYYQNPYWAVGTNRNNQKSNRLNGNVQVSWDILDWLNLTGRIGTNTVWGNGKNWRAAQTYDPDLQPSAGAVSSFVTDSGISVI